MIAANHDPDAMVVIATLVSRVEALIAVSKLADAGFCVRADGIHHASVDPMSIALGGHRLWVPAFQYEDASDFIRETGMTDISMAFAGSRQAIGRLLAVCVGAHCFLTIPAVIAGIVPVPFLVGIALQIFGVPTDPRGRGEFFLAQQADD